jgi:signal transduction histidine kinase
VQLQAAVAIGATNPSEQHAHLAMAIDLAKNSLIEARRSVHALRAPALLDTDLGGALLRLVQQTTAHTGVAATCTVTGTPIPLPADVEGQLLRIGQEALTNALKHAHAAEAQVALRFAAGQVRLQIHDDGVGFDPAQAYADRFGLIGIRERAQQIAATLTIQSAARRGTTITVVAPVNSA